MHSHRPDLPPTWVLYLCIQRSVAMTRRLNFLYFQVQLAVAYSRDICIQGVQRRLELLSRARNSAAQGIRDPPDLSLPQPTVAYILNGTTGKVIRRVVFIAVENIADMRGTNSMYLLPKFNRNMRLYLNFGVLFSGCGVSKP